MKSLFLHSLSMRMLTVILLGVLSAPNIGFAQEATAPVAPADSALTAPVAQDDSTTVPASEDATTAEPGAVENPENAEAGDATDTELMAEQTESENTGFAHDLSPWGMYQGADIVVKAVMIGLVIASIITWTIWIAKGLELTRAKRRLRQELLELKKARTLNQAAEQARAQHSFSSLLIEDAQEELSLSSKSRLERLVSASGRQMSQGTGVLATIGSTAPFVGLFGTVWGIMNSFIGIAKTQTTNLAVVAPGIAEALLATALGLVAAIPAVVIYNVFARSIAGYKGQVADASAQVLLLVSRDLDHQAPAERNPSAYVAKVG